MAASLHSFLFFSFSLAFNRPIPTEGNQRLQKDFPLEKLVPRARLEVPSQCLDLSLRLGLKASHEREVYDFHCSLLAFILLGIPPLEPFSRLEKLRAAKRILTPRNSSGLGHGCFAWASAFGKDQHFNLPLAYGGQNHASLAEQKQAENSEKSSIPIFIQVT